MAKSVLCMSLSLDGFITGADDSPGAAATVQGLGTLFEQDAGVMSHARRHSIHVDVSGRVRRQRP